MLIIGCSKGGEIARKVARRLKASYSELVVDKFPDNETYLMFNTNLKGRDVVLVQSFFPNVNDLLIEVILAAYTAKDLGAKKIRLVATYFPYFRQDKRFNSGECVSIEAIGKMVDRCFDEIIVINPHLHRKKSLRDVFKIKSRELKTTDLIHDYLEGKIDGNYVFVGPDRESGQWINKIARRFKAKAIVLEKTRFNASKVKVSNNKLDGLKGKNVVVYDDMVSTGHTLLETAKGLKKARIKKMLFVCTHGLFLNDSLDKLKKYGNVVSTNTVKNKAAKIDVSGLIADAL